MWWLCFGKNGLRTHVRGLAILAGLLGANTPALGLDSWRATSLSGAPAARSGHTAVWTGTRMIVWGGVAGGAVTQTGGVYDPGTDSWTPTSTVGAPIGRYGHTAVWTGSKMIVWGGSAGSLDGGGAYDPATDSWTALASSGAPSPRTGHTAVWTGSKMVVWGGTWSSGYSEVYLGSGGVYSPATDSWEPTTTSGAPSSRHRHTAIWTGSRMIVWGGGTAGASPPTNSGGIYDPIADTWGATSTSGAPSPRFDARAVWTGARMVVWGGAGGGYLNSGGVYDPAANTWTATSTTGAPSGRLGHTAVWTGTRVVVWAGAGSALMTTNTGGLYDPVLDSWTATTMVDVPPWRWKHTAVWTGTKMIAWGGVLSGNASQGSTAPTSTGGVYDPGIVSAPPFGSFDTPAHGATGVAGAVPVTGWALDDIEVSKVEIYRDPMPGEPTRPNGKVYVGDGTFIPGARPDVAAAYPTHPNADRAGWGLQLLTNMLPGQGNGPFTLYAYAYDGEGHATLLGSKAITCSNATAAVPFGTLDTPGQGQTVSGSAYVVFGWALTPPPGTIPTDGSTLQVFVDDVPLGHPAYNFYRSDIATLFPGYANSDGAVGYFVLDTTALANGIHTIAWSVADDLGRATGIGSRYFWVQN